MAAPCVREPGGRGVAGASRHRGAATAMPRLRPATWSPAREREAWSAACEARPGTRSARPDLASTWPASCTYQPGVVFCGALTPACSDLVRSLPRPWTERMVEMLETASWSRCRVEEVVDAQPAAARVLGGEEDQGLLVGPGREDLRQLHEHRGAARVGERVDLDHGRRVAGGRDEDGLSPVPGRTSATFRRVTSLVAERGLERVDDRGAEGGELLLHPGGDPGGVLGAQAAFRVELPHVLGQAEGPVGVEEGRADGHLDARSRGGDGQEDHRRREDDEATQTAYAIFLSCRTRSTRRRRIVRGMQDSRSARGRVNSMLLTAHRGK